MFKIGDFSKLTQVSIRMLRYYDNIDLFKPAKIDKQSEHRLYTVEQIPKLTRIIFLRDCGFKVSEISSILNQSNDFLIEKFKNKYSEIETQIQKEQIKLKKIQLAQKELLYTKSDIHNQIITKSIPSYQVLSIRRKLDNYFEEELLWEELTLYTDQNKIKVLNNYFSIYYNTASGVDVEICTEISNLQGKNNKNQNIIFKNTNAIPLAASTMVYGDFKNIAESYLTFENWIINNSQYKIIGNTRQIIHRGPWNEKNIDKFLIELQIPIAYK